MGGYVPTGLRLLAVAAAVSGTWASLQAADEWLRQGYAGQGLDWLALLVLRDHLRHSLAPGLAVTGAAVVVALGVSRSVGSRTAERVADGAAGGLVAAALVYTAPELRRAAAALVEPLLTTTDPELRKVIASAVFGALAAPVALLGFRELRGVLRSSPSGWAAQGRGLLLASGALVCLGLVALEVAALAKRAWTPASGPHLVLITVDSLRADRLGSYGYARNTTPRIDALARGGVRFTRAVAQAPWTLPSVASIHTSLYPSQHGADAAERSLEPDRTLLAEVLRNAGYRTVGVVSHPYASSAFGMDQGFEHFDERNAGETRGPTSREVARAALAALGRTRDAYGAPVWTALSGERPFFLWVHFADPHLDYLRHPEYAFARTRRDDLPDAITAAWLRAVAPTLSAEERAWVGDVYDEEIAHTDRWVGELVNGVRALAADRPVVFALSADHGERLFERGSFGHGRDVYDELIRVPLVLFGDLDPNLRGHRVDEPVEISSLARTFVRIAGVDWDFRGPGLLAVATGSAVPEPARSEGSHAWGTDGRKLGIVGEGWKVIQNFDEGSYELYDLDVDPGERLNRWDDPDGDAESLLRRLGAAGQASPDSLRVR